MKPGAYVAGRPLDMGWPASMGTHQFVILVPEDPLTFAFPTHDLGDGTKGLVIGAYNFSGRLQASKDAPSDSEALRKHLLKDKDAPKLQIEPVSLGTSAKPHSMTRR